MRSRRSKVDGEESSNTSWYGVLVSVDTELSCTEFAEHILLCRGVRSVEDGVQRGGILVLSRLLLLSVAEPERRLM
jgi:hypothetical protein